MSWKANILYKFSSNGSTKSGGTKTSTEYKYYSDADNTYYGIVFRGLTAPSDS